MTSVSVPTQSIVSSPVAPIYTVGTATVSPIVQPQTVISTPVVAPVSPTPTCVNGTCTLSSTTTSKPTATLIVKVPADAEVLLRGKSMKRAGEHREWPIPVAKSGVSYKYPVTVRLNGAELASVLTVTDGKTTTLSVTLQDGSLVATPVTTDQVLVASR